MLTHRETVTLGSTLAASVPEELRRGDGLPGTERHGSRRHTTRATLSREAVVLDFAAAGREPGVALVERSTLRSVAHPAALSKDQEAALARLCLGGEALTCVVGPAGSGKTRLLRAAAGAWGAEGIPETGMPTETVAKFLHEHRQGIASPAFALVGGEVLVVDEAAMASSADLAELTRIVASVSGKLVLVGDHRQLGAVEAGGLFRLLVADTRATELTGGHRFLDPWEREATKRLRAGDEDVLAEYEQRGRIQGGSREEMVEAAFAAWGEAREEGRSIVVLAPNHHSVDALANRARAVRVAAREVEAEGITAGRQAVGVGDEVVTTRNDRRLVTTAGAWVRNGDRWRVSGRDEEGQLLVEHTGGRGRAVLPALYVTEHVALAYAMTLHKAQGMTVDRSVVLVDRSTSAEHLYVGMTRGRQDNRVLVVCEATEPERMSAPMPEPLEVLKGILNHRSAELSATEALRDELGRSEDPAHHAWLLEDARWRIDQAAGPDRRAELEALRREAQALSIRRGIRRAAEAELAAAQGALADVGASRREAASDLVEVSRPGFLRRPRRHEIKRVEHRIECLDREHGRCSDRLVVAEERVERARGAEARSEKAIERLPGVEAAVGRRQSWLAEHEPARHWHETLRSGLGAGGVPEDGDDFGIGGPAELATRELEDLLGPLLAQQGHDLEAGMDLGR